ncbi:MAG: DAK2 domain-containing protein [Anaerolineales bacterium]
MTSDSQGSQHREYILSRPIDGQAFKRLIEASLTWLRTNQEVVNALNVFPVPDGDTGTNMVLTMQSAFDEIADSPELSFGKTASLVAHGALMGARGNSGVILSQIWRGFAKTVAELEILDGKSFAQGLALARDTAYKGVVRPVEGTILTVAKDMASAAEAALTETDDPITILEIVVNAADESVERTPELLDVLKEAGVVDAGGKGLYYILEGMLRYIDGLALDKSLTTVMPLSDLVFDDALGSVEPGQDWEVIVDFRPIEPLEIVTFYEKLEQMGTSIQFGEGDGIYRLHIHVPDENYYIPEDYIKTIGTVTKVAKENLLDQMESQAPGCADADIAIEPLEAGNIGVVAITPGAGFAKIFASMGAASIVEGGQTMNPSTEEIIQAFDKLPTDNIIILPNNKNIFMAAKSAAELTVKQVAVIPSRTIPQGLCAMMSLVRDGDFESVVSEMTAALDEVETGEITFATRSVELNGVEVQEGRIITLFNGKLIASSDTVEEACLELLKSAHADHFEIITLYYGENIPSKEAYRMEDVIRSAYPDQEIEIHAGCQPHYHFIISIE